MIAVLKGCADVERDLIRTRAVEGGSRNPKFTPQQEGEVRQRRAECATLKKLAQRNNGGLATISNLAS
jgi:hypothetical protein